MKFTEFPKTNTFSDNDDILITYPGVVGGIARCSAKWVKQATEEGIGEPISEKRKHFAKKEIAFSEELMTQIQNGNFDNVEIGNYFIVDGIKWMIVDFDYWSGTSHHLVIMPMCTIGKMEDLSTSGFMINYTREPDYEGPEYEFSYSKSRLKDYLDVEFSNYISEIFKGHLMSHREVLPEYQMHRYFTFQTDEETGERITIDSANPLTYINGITKVSLCTTYMVCGNPNMTISATGVKPITQNKSTNELVKLSGIANAETEVLNIGERYVLSKNFYMTSLNYDSDGNVMDFSVSVPKGNEMFITDTGSLAMTNEDLECQKRDNSFAKAIRPIFALG